MSLKTGQLILRVNQVTYHLIQKEFKTELVIVIECLNQLLTDELEDSFPRNLALIPVLLQALFENLDNLFWFIDNLFDLLSESDKDVFFNFSVFIDLQDLVVEFKQEYDYSRLFCLEVIQVVEC